MKKNKWVNLHSKKPQNKDKIKSHEWIESSEGGGKMNRKRLFKKIVSILVRCGAKKIAIFGSYARGGGKSGE